MKHINLAIAAVALCGLMGKAQAQNWSFVIQDNAAGTHVNQVNGITGGTATLYATTFNFTGTPSSNDGTGTPAPATTLDFAGFGFTQNPGQYDLSSLFTPADAPGFPQVNGSIGGSTPGSSGYRSFGSFNLSGLAPGTYQEDFSAGAFPDDINSTVPFNDITGTLTLQVNAALVPELKTWQSLGTLLLLGGLLVVRRPHNRQG